jgi:hypothetical protein
VYRYGRYLPDDPTIPEYADVYITSTAVEDDAGTALPPGI